MKRECRHCGEPLDRWGRCTDWGCQVDQRTAQEGWQETANDLRVLWNQR